MRIVCFVLYVLFIALSSTGFSQYSFSPSFRNYSTADGLPSSQVQGVFEDSKGFIWTITNRGVAKFDGYRFQVFTTKNGLPTNNVLLVNEDNRGQMWFMCHDGSYCYLKGDTILPYKGNKRIQSLLKDRLPGPFFFDQKDTLWITTFSGIQLFRCFGDSVSEFIPPVKSTDPTYYLRRVGEKLVTLQVGKEAKTDKIETQDNINYLLSLSGPCKLACSIHLSEKKWAVAGPGGLVLFDESGKVQTQFSESPFVFSSLDRDRSGSIWLTNSNGAYRLKNLDHSMEDSEVFFEGHYIMAVIQDRQGNYWFADRDNGLFFVPSLSISFWSSSRFTKESNVVSVKEIDGKVCFANAAGRVYQLEGNRAVPLTKVGPESNVTLDFQLTPRGAVIVGNKPVLFSQLTSEPVMLGPENATARRMLVLNSGDILFSLSTGLAVWNETSGWQEVNVSGFKERTICAFEEESGTIWLGTENGLWCWKNGTIHKIELPEPYDKSRITDIVFYKSDLACATRGEGVFFYNSSSFAYINETHGLLSDLVDALAVSPKGDLWIGCAKGIQGVCKKDKNWDFEKWDFSKGLPSQEVSDLVFVKDALYAATHAGLVVFYPLRAEKGTAETSLFFSELSSGGSLLSLDSLVTLAPNQRDLHISFTSLNFRTGKDAEYRYRMMGIHDHWILTTAREVDYWNLHPGQYTFEVCAKNENGAWSKPQVIRLCLTAHFTETWWFIGCLILLSFIVLGGWMYWYAIKKRKVLDQKLKMNELRQQALTANMNPHFIFNSLNSIQHYINANKGREANEYLVSFSRLVRMNLESWQSGTVSLKDELDRLDIYLSLEKMRHSDRFDFFIEVDSTLNTFDCIIPPMLLQPYAENAVVHGLSQQQTNGRLFVGIKRFDEQYYLIEIVDNGVGILYSQRSSVGEHKSLALVMNKERLKLFQEVSGLDFSVEILDNSLLSPPSNGTTVRIKLPYFF